MNKHRRGGLMNLPAEGQNVMFKSPYIFGNFQGMELPAKFMDGNFVCGNEAFMPNEVNYWRVMTDDDMTENAPDCYYQKNRERISAYMREYRKKKKAAKAAGTA